MKSPTISPVFLMGPTASGKTKLALDLASLLPIEIISVDSALVYRDMDIGTAKPSDEELARCPHHLINIISPEESYSAALFVNDAERLIEEVSGRRRIPVLVGGTMLYFKALRDGLSELPSADKDIRSQIESQAQTEGWPSLHAELEKRDPEAARRLSPNDSQRIQRALEIVISTGKPLSENYAQSSTKQDKHNYLIIGMEPSERSLLHTQIANRFDTMLQAGFEQEVEALRKRYRLTPNMTSMRCVGYRQIWDYLEGNCDRNAMREKAIAATRQLAKRQITWLRQFKQKWPELHMLDSSRTNSASALALEIERWLQTPR